jgi:hypothetical protein
VRAGSLTPRLFTMDGRQLPVELGKMRALLGDHLPAPRVALGGAAAARPEGVVLRTPDRATIAETCFPGLRPHPQAQSALNASSIESVTVTSADWSPCGEVASRDRSRASTGRADQWPVSRKTKGPDGPSVA